MRILKFPKFKFRFDSTHISREIRKSMDECEEMFVSCVRGYHVYKQIWQASIGEELECRRQISNVVDRYAVCTMKDDEIVGHLPQKISRLCSLFLCRGGSIRCQITGNRRHSVDLPQGGLELPCILIMK